MSKKQKHIKHSQDTLRINVIWSNPFRWPSECLFLWLADSSEIYFRTVNTKSYGVGVVKFKRLSSDINRKKSSCLYANYEGVWAGWCMAPLIFTPGITWRWVINFTPRPLCSCTLHLPGINPRFFGRPTVAWSQYRMRCSGLRHARAQAYSVLWLACHVLLIGIRFERKTGLRNFCFLSRLWK
jgi:hypothetical protein